MSFEGYNQLLCKKGHYFNLDVYDARDIEDIKCPVCKENVAWYNIVDVTNGSYEGKVRIDGYIELKIKTKKNLLLVNRSEINPQDLIKGMDYLGNIPEDPQIQEMSLNGRSLLDLKDDNSALNNLRVVGDKIWH